MLATSCRTRELFSESSLILTDPVSLPRESTMRHHPSVVAHLKNSIRHLDALEMTKSFQTINFASLLGLWQAVRT